MARETRKEVIQLRQLNLQLAFAASSAPRKNVENELGAIDHLQVEGFFEVAKLGWREVVVEDYEVRFSEEISECIQLARFVELML